VSCLSTIVPLLILLSGTLWAAQEERFDPPLGGSYLGVSLRDAPEGDPAPVRVARGAVVVRSVEPGSAAERAGLRPGDRVLRFGDAGPIADLAALPRAVKSLPPREPAEIEVFRDGQRLSLTVVPDPAILRDHYEIVGHLRDSSFLKGRSDFDAALRGILESVPPALRRARRASEAYEILNSAVGGLGTSHTAVIPPWTYSNLLASDRDETGGFATGLILDRIGGRAGGEVVFFAGEVAAGGAAAGVLQAGDEVLMVNGAPIAASPRLTLAGFEASRPRYTLQVDRGETIRLEIRRRRDGPVETVALTADRALNGVIVARASRRIAIQGGRRVLIVHLWNLLSLKLPDLLEGYLKDRNEPAEGLVIDLRGRGGQVRVMSRLAAILKLEKRPLALLIDGETRSAKEILAFQLKGSPDTVLVGETTAGAVLPASYRQLAGGGMLMLPLEPGGINRLTGEESLEGRGVDPDLRVPRAGIYAAGADPILDAGIRAVVDLLDPQARRKRL